MKIDKSPFYVGLAVILFALGNFYAAEQKSAPSSDSTQPLAKSPAVDLARQLNQAFIEVADTVSPAVVVISVVQKQNAQMMDDQEGNPFWDMLPPDIRKRFFEEYGRRDRGNGRNVVPIPRPRAQVGRGSGIVISEDGYILTNNHVVENAEKITVRFKDSREYTAEIKGRDPQSDIAVIKIKNVKNLAHAKLGDSAAARVGEFVLAIGAPFDLNYSVTVGHISAKGRSFGREFGANADQDFIQTDASINPGNSGGPLVNLYGEVVGINSMIRGIGTGIGFAVPINLAKRVSDHLIKDGKFTRSRIGVAIGDLREFQDYKNQAPNLEDGVVISEILPDAPAAKSELKAGDIVTSVDGRPVKTSRELKEEIAYKKVGETVTLDVVRLQAAGKSKNLKVKVKTDAFPDEEESASGKKSRATDNGESSNLGLTVKSLTKELADEFGVDMSAGVIVTSVEANSAADEKGIKAGDIITEVNRSSVSNLKQFRDAIKAADPKKGVVINFTSKGTSRFTVLKEE
ncbi:MAG: trypsin-like peptidase domain-containing protein [Verrucomicrobiota bacterium]|nr:trypsin-like peptidase domain-containing protein [Verrucomicrobiota bacterium]